MEKLVPPTYVRQARDTLRTRESKVNELLEKVWPIKLYCLNFSTNFEFQRKWQEDGWEESEVEDFLRDLAVMASNNFSKSCGVGEREARIASHLVARRHFGLGHGIGRSGDLAEVQPKAAGSSVLYRLTNALALDALRSLGVPSVRAALVVPVCTGMSVALVLMTLRQQRPKAQLVLWSRIDQKACFKAITTAGFQPVVVELVLDGDQLK